MATTRAARSRAGEEWTRSQVVEWLATQGRAITADTWSAYVKREQAPAPVRRVGATPLWDAGQVRQWQASAPGRGAPGVERPSRRRPPRTD